MTLAELAASTSRAEFLRTVLGEPIKRYVRCKTKTGIIPCMDSMELSKLNGYNPLTYLGRGVFSYNTYEGIELFPDNWLLEHIAAPK